MEGLEIATTNQTTEQVEEQPRAMRRRGVIAGAAALMAGMMARQAVQTTEAGTPKVGINTTGTGTPLILGITTNTPTSPQETTSIDDPSSTELSSVLFSAANYSTPGSIILAPANSRVALHGFTAGPDTLSGQTHIGVLGQTDSGYGVHGIAGTGHGVFGKTAAPFAAAGYGVYGNASSGHAVVGSTDAPINTGAGGVVGLASGAGNYGVKGTNNTNGYGVYGEALSDGGRGVSGIALTGTHAIGVYGNAGTYAVYGEAVGTDGNGVTGVSLTGAHAIGVYGRTNSGTGLYGEALAGGNGVYGIAQAAGTSQVVAGVFGDSTTTYGVIGRTTAAGYSGLTAITSTPNVAALAATATVNTAYAAYFQGTTVVQGNFAVVGGSKSAAVPHPDGSHRLVYCVEAPESWFEDVGKAKLVNGKAEVKLDTDFAAVVHADDYHIFLTAYGNTNGLHVTVQAAGGFSVEEHNGGKGNLSFSWRVMAKRKDIAGTRLAKFDLPKIKTPDPDKLPKFEPPKAAPLPVPPPKP